MNEANTDLSMKYNELIANQVQPQPQPHIAGPDEIKLAMEHILTEIDSE